MSSWGYAELNSWPQERSSSALQQREQLELQQQQELLVGSKRLRRDPAGINEQQQLWSLRVPTSDLDTISESFQGEGVRGRDVGSSRFYMDETSFLDSDEAVSSSCHFSLSDVGARIGLFNQPAPSQKEMEESWEAINNLGDMDDLFGPNNSSFVQPSSLEQSLSSQASPPTPSSSSVLLLGSSNQLPPAIGDFRNSSCLQVNSSSPSSTSNGKVTSSDSAYRPADISPLLQGGPVKSSTMFGSSFEQQHEHKQQVCRRLESYFQASMGVPCEALVGAQQVEGGGRISFTGIDQGDQVVVEGREGDEFVQPWSDSRREANSTCSSHGGHDEGSSLEAAVFYQLASTMSKLDVGTRLCIRNALYRLAKSASSRNRDETGGLGSKFDSSPSGRNADIACLETCTNPIDRTVASLLFYKQEQQQTQTQHEQQQQQQQTLGNIITPQETYSGCLSPHSAISSSSCVTKPPEIRLQLPPPPPPTQMVSRPELPMMMLNTSSSLFGNKLPLPPLRYNRHNRRL